MFTATRVLSVMTAGVAAFAVGSCDSGSPAESEPEVVAAIAIAQVNVSLAVREVVHLTPTFRDARGRVLVDVQDAEWQSSDPSTVTVDSDGKVSGVKFGGPVTITVSAGTASASASVSAAPIVRFPDAELAVGVDSTVELVVHLLDFFGVVLATETPAWVSANAAVAAVTAPGRVTGVTVGETVLTALHRGQTRTVAVAVGVPSPDDGLWGGYWASAVNPGALNQNRPVSIEIRFGQVRRFELRALASAGQCVFTLASNPAALITASRFSFALPLGSAADGEITGPTTLRVSLAPIATTAESYQCNPGSEPPLNAGSGIVAGVLALSR